MPIITNNYRPSFLFRNGHFSTIYSSKFRVASKIEHTRERLYLLDQDFLDIDWSFAKKPSKKAVILLHGLEGNSKRTYMVCQALQLISNGWDTASVNYRGCSGEPNINYDSYNAGRTEDLESVINYVLEKDTYEDIALVGFSLGGNLLLKYLGERDFVPTQIKKAVAVSVPLSLRGSLEALNKSHNWLYSLSFLIKLRKKYKIKMEQFPEKETVDYKKIKSLLDFDNLYTAPAHGFRDAYDYYQKNSSLQFLPNIKIPFYILNAKNDSFLSQDCYPIDIASSMKNFFLETPKYGGHVGFHKTNGIYYSEERAVNFLNNL